jgi:[ribosomal protein S18]-alanine N-acetyltransferase
LTERYRIEPMTVGDLADVLSIERVSFATPWTEENFRYELEENPAAWNVVVRDGDAVVGFACAYVVAGELMINDVAVTPGRRGDGIGRALVRHLLDGSIARGCRTATLEVRPANTPARRIYDSLGFRVVGRRRGYYADTGEDALVMARELL